MKIMPSLFAAAFVLAPEAFAASVDITFCLNESTNFYFHNKAGTENTERPGLVVDFIRDLEKKLDIPVKIIRRTKRACQKLIQSNEMDAYGIVSYEESRDKAFAYPPLKDGKPDQQYAFNTAGYALYYDASSSLNWNGERIADLAQWKIGGIDGNSVVDNLRSAGIKIQTFKSLEAMIKRLQNKELDAIAIHGNQVERVSDKMGLKKHNKILYTKDYFIVFSDKFHKNQPEISEKIWRFSSQYLNSAEGKQAVKKYDQLENF